MKHYFISEEAHFDVGIHLHKKLNRFQLSLGFIDIILAKENNEFFILIGIGIPFYKLIGIGIIIE